MHSNLPKADLFLGKSISRFPNAALDAFKLDGIYYDTIPDIRRSRRECYGTKLETVLVYGKR
jgi:hypothetical protein